MRQPVDGGTKKALPLGGETKGGMEEEGSVKLAVLMAKMASVT